MIERVPKIVSTKVLLRSGGRIHVSVQNVTSQPVSLKPHMVIGSMSTATQVIVDDLVQREPGRESLVQCPTLSPRWEERVRAQLTRWEKMILMCALPKVPNTKFD